MHSCSFKSSYGLSSIRKNSSFTCLCNFDELFSREESACIFWILKNKNAFPTPREKKFVKIAQTSKRRVFAYARQPIRAFEWARMHFPRLDLAVSRPPNRKIKNVTCAISCEYPAHIGNNGPKSENPAVLTLTLEIYPVNLPQNFFGDSWECPPQAFFWF